ncbi:MAG: 2-oxo acid dehydrogenase subunit E2 [Nitrososphaerales archaeon]|nr:2-oxo acid dehydrogenase subunit E2 [Nitrososphaerales archaeon]
MVYSFKMPDIGEGVAEGEILKWMVKEGDRVNEDQPLVEVMTDKVNVQIPAPRSGTISKIFVREGEIAKVGQTIVDISENSSTASPSQPAPPPVQMRAPPPRVAPMPSPEPAMGVLATPATRRLSRELGVELSSVRGTGPGGRVTDDDVRRAAGQGPTGAATSAVMQAQMAPRTSGKEELVPLRGIRKTIAERMVKSRETTAQVTHVDEADMTELVRLRESLKAEAEKKGVRLTYLPFMIGAIVLALKEFPYVNSTLDAQNGNIILKKYYNIGMATDTAQGLMVPVVKDADTKDIFTLAGEVERLADKARKGQLTLDEVRGSTFTITNVGAIGGLFATPLINLPEVAIIGIHKITKRPVVRDGRVEIRDTMYVSLSFDHRVLDGAYAARFTSRVIEMLQDPKKLQSSMQASQLSKV